MDSTLPELKRRPQWLTWRFESHAGDKKPRKVPYYATGGFRTEDRRQGTQGSPEDRARLVRYEVAIGHAPPAGKGGVGFAFLPDDGLAGIDLDKVIDLETGEISERALNIVKACASYTELSPSKTGLHIFVATDIVGRFKSFKNNSIGVEVFCGAQFFTFTGEHWSGTPDAIAPIDEKTLKRLQATVRGKKPTAAA
jgi:putative DNA primase/helicase